MEGDLELPGARGDREAHQLPRDPRSCEHPQVTAAVGARPTQAHAAPDRQPGRCLGAHEGPQQQQGLPGARQAMGSLMPGDRLL
eukprot:6192534-Pyramimonas_sp.AAC.1